MSSALPTAPAAPHTGRRLDLVVAAQQVVARGGLRALTHRAVDATAGLPEGSCSSYFRTRLALLTALTEHVGHQLRAHVLDLAGELSRIDGDSPADDSGDAERLARVVAQVAGSFEDLLADPGVVIVQAELGLEALRQPELAEALDAWRSGLVDIVRAIGSTSGKGQVSGHAEALVAALQGVLVGGLRHTGGAPAAAAARAAYLEDAIGMLLTPLA